MVTPRFTLYDMNRLIYVFAIAAALLAGACAGKRPATTAAYIADRTVECLGQDAGGAQRVRVWGRGRDFGAAKADAAKTAVEAVMFGYITAGAGNCNAWPVIDNEGAARRANPQYFDKFFRNGGKYKKFVKSERVSRSEAHYGGDGVAVMMEITVDRAKLVRQLSKDHILQ